MPIPIPALETIEDFLAQKRIAMIGVSRNPKDFSSALFEELRKRGYDMVPVNPRVSAVLGQPCYARVQDIQPPVDAALLMTTLRLPTRLLRIAPMPAFVASGCTGQAAKERSARRRSHSARSAEFR